MIEDIRWMKVIQLTPAVGLGETTCIQACKEGLTVYNGLDNPGKPMKNPPTMIINNAAYFILSIWLTG